jgi:subtilisin-like proprotein convertase family protein
MNRIRFSFCRSLTLSLFYFWTGGNLQAINDPKALLCDVPELLQATMITDSTVALTWTDVGDRYVLELRPVDVPLNGVPTHVVNQDPPFAVNDLMPGVQYRYRLRTICAPGDTSSWSVTRTFITDLNNARPCPLDIGLRDTSCTNPEFFKLYVDDAPGTNLGGDVRLRGVRLMVEHPWRSDLRIWLIAPDGVRRQLIGGLNAGDRNIGDPSGVVCSRFIELTDDVTIAKPLSTAAEKDNITGYYLPVEPLAGFHTGQNPNGIWQVEICDGKANDRGRLRLFGLVFERPDCPSPYGMNALNIQENSAELQWTADTQGIGWILEYGPSGFQPGLGGFAGTGGAIVNLPQPSDSSYSLFGLQPLQWYDAYVRRQCSPGVWSANSYAATFFTSCPPSMLEHSDSTPICNTGCSVACPLPGLWQNVPDDDYDWKVRTGPGLTYPNAGPPAAPSGAGNYLFFRNSCTFSGAAGKKAVLRSRCVEIQAPPDAACFFSLDLYMHAKVGQMGALVLQISQDAGQTWSTLRTWSGNQGKRWLREYVHLGAYSGRTVLLQLIANGALGSYGDIAIDNLAFYGAAPAGTPDFVFFRDQDGDGYGNPGLKLVACNPALPPGYSTIGGDCNDAAAAIHPGAQEMLCNQVDENCNGLADDGAIAVPTASGVAICQGETAFVQAINAPTGTFYWYATAQGGAAVGTGAQFMLIGLQSDTTIYLADSLSGGCSSARRAVTVTVHPAPRLTAPGTESVCFGATLDLATLSFGDSSSAGGALRYYAAWPLTAVNQLASTVVSPLTTTTYYVQSLTNFGCSDTASVLVQALPAPSVHISEGDTLALCRREAAVLTALGTGREPLSFLWNNTLTFSQIPVSGGAVGGDQPYTVTITDGNGCTASDQAVILTLNSITQTSILSVQQVSVCDGANGSFTLQPLNGTGPFNVNWSGAMSGQIQQIFGAVSINNLMQGGYRVTVSDAVGCSMVLPQIVLNAPGLSVSIDTIRHPVCPDISDGCIELSVSGTSPQISWSHGPQTASVCNLAPGLYSVTITDGGCVQVLSDIPVQAPPAFQAIVNQIMSVQCAGAMNGFIDLAVFGGTPPYAYQWSNTGTTQDIQHIPGGLYACTVTDANGCPAIISNLEVTEPLPLTISSDTTAEVRCFGGKDGFAVVTAAGGAPPYLYQWSHGASGASTGAVPIGNYTVTVKDSRGCPAEWTAVITQPDILHIELSVTSPGCPGVEDGSIEATVTGGVGPYHYSWNTGDQTGALTGIGDGQYQVSVMDANGCVQLSPVQILSYVQSIAVSVDSIAQVSCFGDQTGYIAIDIAGVQGVPSIRWNGQPGGMVLKQVPSGTYVLEIVDEQGCMLLDTFIINQPDLPLEVRLLEKSDALCHGAPNGFISVSGQGGTAPFSFQWNQGAQTAILGAVPAGAYSVTMTDAAGCTAILGPINVVEPPALFIQAELSDVPCFGLSTGEIEIQASGGIPPYAYQWSRGDTVSHVYNLPPGAYVVTVLDASGCAQVLGDLEVRLQSEQFTVTVLDVTPVSCAGAADGRIRVRVDNGQGPFQFAWSAPIGLHANLPVGEDVANGLSGGLYSVTVTDAAGCFAVSNVFQIEEAPPLLLGIDTIIQNICKGTEAGQISATGSGGLPPYVYHWNNGDMTAVSDALAAGLYFLTITDLQGCSRQAGPLQVTEPASILSITLDSLRNDRCGQTEGVIRIVADGGMPPYDYLWSNGGTQNIVAGIPAGNYQLTLTDALGCARISPVYMLTGQSMPLMPGAITVQAVDCFGDSTGSIEILMSGGEPPYEWLWNNGQGVSSITQLPAGTYIYTVTDQADCIFTGAVAVAQPLLPLHASAAAAWTGTDWTVTVTAEGGTPPYDYQWDTGTGSQTGPQAFGLPDGVYVVTVSDDRGCTYFLTVDPRTVGAVGPSERTSWVASPNPGAGWIFLKGEGLLPRRIRVTAASGAGDIRYYSWPDDGLLDCTSLPNGMYFLLLDFSDGSQKRLRYVKCANLE